MGALGRCTQRIARLPCLVYGIGRCAWSLARSMFLVDAIKVALGCRALVLLHIYTAVHFHMFSLVKYLYSSPFFLHTAAVR